MDIVSSIMQNVTGTAGTAGVKYFEVLLWKISKKGRIQCILFFLLTQNTNRMLYIISQTAIVFVVVQSRPHIKGQKWQE